MSSERDTSVGLVLLGCLAVATLVFLGLGQPLYAVPIAIWAHAVGASLDARP